jgi:antitoxin component YwqK of YwqJK toxin-antitoxin module
MNFYMYKHYQYQQQAVVFMEWLKHFVIQKNENGILVNDWKQGYHYEKYRDGQLKTECNYDRNQRHGIQRCWYWNESLQYEHGYKHGQRHGIHQWWYENGPFMGSENYADGVPISKLCNCKIRA